MRVPYDMSIWNLEREHELVSFAQAAIENKAVKKPDKMQKLRKFAGMILSLFSTKALQK